MNNDHWLVFVVGVVLLLLSGLVISICVITSDDLRADISALQERRTKDSLTIDELRNQLLYADPLVIETIIVDGSIIRQRYRNGDSVLKVW